MTGAGKITDTERQRILSQYIASEVAGIRKARVETHSPDQAVLVYGNRVNHLLHLILALLTLGLWIIPWVVMACAGGEKRKIVRVDDFGNVLLT